MAIPIAVRNPARPVTPSSILVTAPINPAITPSCIPKFNPQPDCTIGTSERTRTEFIANLTIVSLIDVPMLMLTKGAITNIESRKRAIITLGQPAFSMSFPILSNT